MNVSVHDVGRYIVRFVRFCYFVDGAPNPQCQGHEVRKIAASLRSLTSVSLDDILKVGQWFSPSNFPQYYAVPFAPRRHTLLDDCVDSQLLKLSSLCRPKSKQVCHTIRVGQGRSVHTLRLWPRTRIIILFGQANLWTSRWQLWCCEAHRQTLQTLVSPLGIFRSLTDVSL